MADLTRRPTGAALHAAADATNDAADHDELHAAAAIIEGVPGSVYVTRWIAGLVERHGVPTVETCGGCSTCLAATADLIGARLWPTQVGMIVCPDCGNKRCPRATHHDNACTGSNEPEQPGSRYGGLCSHCPPGCVSCSPPDCECYTHQDEPDRRTGTPYLDSLAEAARLADEANRRTEG
jgi:hypothetical protein